MKYFSIIILNILLASSVYAAGTFYSTPHATTGKLFFDASVQVQQDTDITSTPGLVFDASTININAEKIEIPTTTPGNIIFDRGLIIKNIGIQQNESLSGFTIDNLTQNSESIKFRNKMGSNYIDLELGPKIFQLDTSFNNGTDAPLLKFINDPSATTKSQLTINSQREFDGSTTESFTISNTLKIGATTISNDAGKLKFDKEISVADLKLTTPSLGTLGIASTLGNQVVTREWVHKRNYLTTGLLLALKAGLDLSEVNQSDDNLFFRTTEWSIDDVIPTGEGRTLLSSLNFVDILDGPANWATLPTTGSQANIPRLPVESHRHEVGSVIAFNYSDTIGDGNDDTRLIWQTINIFTGEAIDHDQEERACGQNNKNNYNQSIDVFDIFINVDGSYSKVNRGNDPRTANDQVSRCEIYVHCPVNYGIFLVAQRDDVDLFDGHDTLHFLFPYTSSVNNVVPASLRNAESFRVAGGAGQNDYSMKAFCVPLTPKVIDETKNTKQ